MDLLERGRFLDELLSTLRGVGRGGGAIALVGGEAGVGKTSLVERFVRLAQRDAPPPRVLWGVCDALFTPRPLSPLFDIAQQAGGALRAQVEGGADRERIFGAFLRELGRAPPVSVAVFEDVHWADDATLDVLKYVSRRIRQTTTLLIVTYRDDEVGPAHPFRLVLGELPHDAVRRISLPLLSRDAVGELARRAGRTRTASSPRTTRGSRS